MTIASTMKKLGRRAAGTWGRLKMKSQKRAANNAVRRSVDGTSTEPCGDSTECPDVSLPHVMLSAAGFYIGTNCHLCGLISRDSEYFVEREMAEASLRYHELAARKALL